MVRGAVGAQGGDKGVQRRGSVLHHQIGRQLRREIAGIGEGQALGVGLHEEVEGVDHLHLGGQRHLDAELGHGVGKTSRASQLPNGSCCQLMKCSAGVIFRA